MLALSGAAQVSDRLIVVPPGTGLGGRGFTKTTPSNSPHYTPAHAEQLASRLPTGQASQIDAATATASSTAVSGNKYDALRRQLVRQTARRRTDRGGCDTSDNRNRRLSRHVLSVDEHGGRSVFPDIRRAVRRAAVSFGPVGVPAGSGQGGDEIGPRLGHVRAVGVINQFDGHRVG